MKFWQELLILFAAISFTVSVKAQKGIDTDTPFGQGEDSVTCVENLRMFTTYAKNGAFKDAAEFWEKVYAECPKYLFIWSRNYKKANRGRKKSRKTRKSDKPFNGGL